MIRSIIHLPSPISAKPAGWSGVTARLLPRLMILVLAILLPVANANPFPESATIYLNGIDGSELAVGQVLFGESVDGQSGFSVDIDNSQFSEHFLSMRPFRCLEGEAEWFCYLPYPYELRNTVSADDLSDLEYNLLFIKKTPQEFGIDAWNGLYYQLTLNDDGTIEGALLEGDLNSLQSPPAETYAKPIDLDEFVEASKSKRLYPSLVIR